MAVTLNLRGLLRRLQPARQLTPAEKQEIEAEAKASEHAKAQHGKLRDEARIYADQIIGKLIDLNVCYRYKKSEQAFGESVKAISFRRPFILTEEAIYLEVDLRPGRSPRGIGVDELADERVLKNLSIVCEHPVYFKYKEGSGAWYIVERETGKRGIPLHVKYADVIAGRPASADGLTLPIGVGENKKTLYKSLGQMYSMLVAGTTGGGKSNFLSVLLCTLIRFNSPKRLQLMLVDLKGGMEFAYFNGVPHLLQLPASALKPKKKRRKRIVLSQDAEPELEVEAQEEEPEAQPEPEIEPHRLVPAIIEKREQVAGGLGWLIREGERRMELLKNRKAKSIGQYNHNNRGNALPHIVLIVDEWADVKLDKDGGKDAEENLINIASRFRAVGIHVILCTQVPNKEVVSIRIKNVMPARLVFNCPDQYASMLVLGDASAYGLEPAGRSFFVWGSSRLEAQTPFINNDQVASIVEQAIAGKFEEAETLDHDVTDEEILDWALEHNSGDLDSRGIYLAFRGRGFAKGQAEEFCKRYEGKDVVIGSSVYRVMAGTGRKPRRLLPVEDSELPEKTPLASRSNVLPQFERSDPEEKA